MLTKEKIVEYTKKYGLMIVTACIAIFLIARLLEIQMTFLDSLYHEMNILRLNTLVRGYLIQKLIFTTILMLEGGACVAFYYFSHGGRKFRDLAQLCFVSAVFVYSIFEPETLFRVSRADLLFWLKVERVFSAALFAAFQILTYNFVDFRRAAAVKRITVGITGLTCLLTVLLPTIYANVILAVFLLFMIGNMFFFLYLFVSQGQMKKYMPVLLPVMLMLFTVLILLRYRLSAQGAGNLYNKLIIIVSIQNLSWFVIIVWKYNIKIQYRQDKSQQAEDVRRDKEMFRNTAGRQLESSLRLIQNIVDVLEENIPLDSVQSRKELQLLKSKIESMDNVINEYSWLNDENACIMHFTELSINNMIFSAMRTSETEDAKKVWLKMEDHIGNVFGDPFYLTKAFHDLYEQLCSIADLGQVFVEVKKEGATAQISLKVSERILPARKLNQLMNGGKTVALAEPKTEELIDAIEQFKEIIRAHSGNIWIREKDGYSILYCSLPVIAEKEEEDEKKIDLPGSGKSQENWSRLVIVSSEREQGELLSTYLHNTAFEIIIIRDGEEAIDYIQNNHFINLVILGNLLKGIDRLAFCQRLRRIYSSVSLPMLILMPERRVSSMDVYASYTNAYLTEPYSRGELLAIIRSLELMKRSTDEAMEAKLALLQSQMNPHFIFNTLSAIMGLCIKEPLKAHELLGDFSTYLRATLMDNNGRKKIPVWKELEHVETYLNISRARFGDLVRWETVMKCDEEALILPLLIEPIVENCIVHAFVRDKPILVRTVLTKENEMIRVMVEDNGSGMTDEKIQEVLTGGENGSFGLSVLTKRLMMEYGQSLKIESREGVGTRVEYYIPIQKSTDVLLDL